MPPRMRSGGAALIITLNIIVLMLFLLVAFFSQSALQRGSANASSGIAAKDIFVNGAIDMIIADLEQEIADGSNFTNVVAGATTNTLYLPISRYSMVPALSGCPGTAGVENLLKRSASGIPFYTGASYYQDGVSRASTSSSASTSLNGRKISTARWNRSLLLARANTNSASDTAPVASFTAPDWLLVARSGTNPTSWSTSLRWSTTNPATVIGRVAYLIFDEGGLLDANVAGYPPALTNAASLDVSRKPGACFADLSQIGMTARQTESLVGWRNYVTAGATGSYPSYAFPDSGAAYATAMLGTTNGFTRIASTNAVAAGSAPPRTDRMFATRQEMISFLTGADPSGATAALNALQYLTSYSRDLNQPSYFPDPSRPTIMPLGSGGNDSYGKDDQINPAPLTVCVTSSFVRNDGGRSNIGDPLLRKRFPLALLNWITPEGPSATASAATLAAYTSLGVPSSLLQAGTSTNITKYFGLTWNATGTNAGSWTYRAGSNAPILTLSQIVPLGRDPDFFELLKAGLTAGSLGKAFMASGGSTATPDGYNQAQDNCLDAQIIQIGANLIDQSDPDSYPTRIQFSNGSLLGGGVREYRGIEDLPYLYRVREAKLVTADSSPSATQLPKAGVTLTNAGSAVVMLQPEIWNPHVMTSNGAPRPTSFRLQARTVDPIARTAVSYVLGTRWITQTGTMLSFSNASTNLDATMTFSIPSGRSDLFREPTLLIKPGIPSGSMLAGPGPYTSLYSAGQFTVNGMTDDRSYTGIPMGTVPVAFTATIPSGGIASGYPSSASAGIVPSGYAYYPTPGTAGLSSPGILLTLQCQDTTGQWITYDEKFTAAPNSASGYGIPSTGTNPAAAVFQYNVNKTFYLSSNTTAGRNVIGSEACVAAIDPRTSRFGMLACGSMGSNDPSSSFPLGAAPGGDSSGTAPLFAGGWAAPLGASTSVLTNAAAQAAVKSMRPDEYGGFLIALGEGPTAGGWTPSGTNARTRPGLLCQNNPGIDTSANDRFTNDPQNPTSYPNQFFADPDGVVRRGMSAQVPSSTGIPAAYPASNNPSGLTMTPAFQWSNAVALTIASGINANEVLGRPVILNRPFRSVAELGGVFTGTPWRNLDFTIPESGATTLLDLFCLNDTSDSKAMVAGRVNLNTRQIPVLRAILAGAYKDEINPRNSIPGGTLSTSLAGSVATALVTRTHGTSLPAGPLMNLSELTGGWYSQINTTGGLVNGGASYCGFSGDSFSSSMNDLTAVLASVGTDP